MGMPFAKTLTTTFVGVILIINVAHCWIVRLPCKTEANFTVKVQGHVLKNCIIGESSAAMVEQCFENCEDQQGCKSINYKDGGEKNCQLNSKVKEAALASEFGADGVWTYYATNYNTTNIGTYCEDYTPCPTGIYCIDTCQCPGYECVECSPGYRFKNELQCTDINECESNPCQHGATCINHVNRFQCNCLAGYIGVRCEIDINECDSNPCQNRATCINDVNRFQCSCVPGYSGVHCENDINECGSNPCQHGAACVNQVNRFQCNCLPGYKGVYCETDIDECASNPCQYGGTCNNHVNKFSCTCLPNTFGTRCEVKQYESCKAAYDDGKRSNGVYNLKIGSHYCMLEGSSCGEGGWTLAIKSKGDSDIFKADSSYWTTNAYFHQTPSLGKENAKYRAFNELSFNKICLTMKKYQESTYSALVYDKSSSSLLSIFRGGQLKIGLSRSTWLALRPGAYLQPNCNQNGFNIYDWNGRLIVRFGMMMNNEYGCWTPDSALGIGIASSQRSNMERQGDPSEYMAYIFVK